VIVSFVRGSAAAGLTARATCRDVAPASPNLTAEISTPAAGPAASGAVPVSQAAMARDVVVMHTRSRMGRDMVSPGGLPLVAEVGTRP
jgi:hypothetical protein